MSNTARIETNNCIVWTRVSTKYQEENGVALTTNELYARSMQRNTV